MKRKNVSKKVAAIAVIIIALLSMPIVNLAHSGRTDSSGGHKDNKNKSGLGPYHYHCGGHPAHLHDGGVCPYASSATPASTQAAPKSTTTTQPTTSSKTTTSSSSATKTTSTVKPTTSSKIEVTSVEVDVKDLEVLIGEKHKLTATVSPSNAKDKNVTWTSSNKEIVMIDSEGEIVALGIGEAIITAKTSNGKEAVVNVTVKPIKVTEIKISESEINLKVDESATLIATVLPEDATDKEVEWTSENTEIIAVEDGVITAVAPGSAKVICSSKDGIKAEVNVVVEEPEVEEVVATTVEEDNSSNTVEKESVVVENNEEKEEVKEVQKVETTPFGTAGGFIALAGLVCLPIWGIKLRNKEEKFNFIKFIGNLFSYVLSIFTLFISTAATSALGLLVTLATSLSIVPPICKLINEKINGKYTVKIRIITYIVGFILMIVML